MDNQWHGYLVVNNEGDLEGLSDETRLPGYIYSAEQVVIAFAPAVAPPDTRPLPARLSRHTRGWALVNSCHRVTPLEVRTLDQLYARTPFKGRHLDFLANAQVVGIGCGSVGGRIMRQLAQAGVRRFVLTDPERLDMANLSRHVGDLSDLGRFKAPVAREQTQRIQPGAEVQCYTEDLFDRDDDELHQIFGGASLFVATTDRKAVQLQTNELAMRLGVPQVHAGLYEGTRGGEVFRVLPGTGRPCYGCLRTLPDLQPVERAVDYGTGVTADDFEGEPGLSAPIEQLSSVATQMALSTLLRHEPDSLLGNAFSEEDQFLLVGSACSNGFYPFRRAFDTYFQRLSGPRSDCPLPHSDQT